MPVTLPFGGSAAAAGAAGAAGSGAVRPASAGGPGRRLAAGCRGAGFWAWRVGGRRRPAAVPARACASGVARGPAMRRGPAGRGRGASSAPLGQGGLRPWAVRRRPTRTRRSGARCSQAAFMPASVQPDAATRLNRASQRVMICPPAVASRNAATPATSTPGAKCPARSRRSAGRPRRRSAVRRARRRVAQLADARRRRARGCRRRGRPRRARTSPSSSARQPSLVANSTTARPSAAAPVASTKA